MIEEPHKCVKKKSPLQVKTIKSVDIYDEDFIKSQIPDDYKCKYCGYKKRKYKSGLVKERHSFNCEETKMNKCPYCKKSNTGKNINALMFHCGGERGEFWSCAMCGAEWREESRCVITRKRIK